MFEIFYKVIDNGRRIRRQEKRTPKKAFWYDIFVYTILRFNSLSV